MFWLLTSTEGLMLYNLVFGFLLMFFVYFILLA